MSMRQTIYHNIDHIIRGGEYDPSDLVLDAVWEDVLLEDGPEALWDAIDGDGKYGALLANFTATGSAKDAGLLRRRMQQLTRTSAKWHLDKLEGCAWDCWEQESQSRAVF